MENNLDNTTTTVEAQETTNQPNAADLQAEIDRLNAENEKLRKANTNASADASKWKKQYQDKLSAEEKAEQDRAEQLAAMQTELETLRKEKDVAGYVASLTNPRIGFEAELAQVVAEAMQSGNAQAVIDGLGKFVEAHDKALRESMLRGNPVPVAGTVKGVTKEQFDAMGYKERLKLFNEQPELYKEFTK